MRRSAVPGQRIINTIQAIIHQSAIDFLKEKVVVEVR
jgi:hypothetical protein